MAAALDDLLDACARLAQMGCTVIGARALNLAGGCRSVVEISPPHPRVPLEAGRMRTTARSTTFAARVGGCQVEWTHPR